MCRSVPERFEGIPNVATLPETTVFPCGGDCVIGVGCFGSQLFGAIWSSPRSVVCGQQDEDYFDRMSECKSFG
jgi:hypothetical protein